MVGVDDNYSGDGGVFFGGEVHLVVLIHEVVQQPAFVRPAVSSCNWCNDDDDHDDGDDDFYLEVRWVFVLNNVSLNASVATF